MFMKILLSWVLLIAPIFVYGIFEIEYLGEATYRWYILTVWLTVFFIFGMYKIWA